MLSGRQQMEGGVPFVSQFYGSLNVLVGGVVHEIHEAKEEQGDALMSALFSLVQHSALEAIQARLRFSERLIFG